MICFVALLTLNASHMVGSIIGGVANVGSAIYGAIKSSQAAKKSQALIQNQREENRRWYDARMAEDYTKRADMQNILRKQRDLLGEQYSRARAANVVAGGTDEALAMQQASANATLGDTMADIAAQSSAYKEGIESQYRGQDATLTQQQVGVFQNHAQQIADAAAQMGKATAGLSQGIAGGNGGQENKEKKDI